MEKNECVEIVNKRFQGKAKEILLNQIELFFTTDNEIVKTKYSVGDDVFLKKGTFIHGIFGELENFDYTLENGFVSVDFTAEADAHTLAARIEQEWYDDYRLEEQNMYNPNAYFPSEVYVFDATMNWCVVFTHETTDWESELENPMKAAESRVCIICKR